MARYRAQQGSAIEASQQQLGHRTLGCSSNLFNTHSLSYFTVLGIHKTVQGYAYHGAGGEQTPPNNYMDLELENHQDYVNCWEGGHCYKNTKEKHLTWPGGGEVGYRNFPV